MAGREIRERLRGRLFRVVTLILFAVVAAAVVTLRHSTEFQCSSLVSLLTGHLMP